jgi:hypothetical protein
MREGLRAFVASSGAKVCGIVGVVLIAFAGPSAGWAQTKPPRSGSKDFKLYQSLVKSAKSSERLNGGWVVESPTHVVHSTISKEYTAAAAVHLHRFHRRFVSIFREEFKDTRKPVAYAFATNEEYLKFSPESKGSWGRFRTEYNGKTLVKDLAWYSLPEGEKDFYKTEFEVVQHEAAHQLLDAYTDNQGIPRWFHEGLATFFESWDLDQDNDRNILSGVAGRRGTGVCLAYPDQPAPLLREFWIDLRTLLSAQDFQVFHSGPRKWPPVKDEVRDFKEQMVTEVQYNQAWSVLAFLIDNEVGREQFVRLVGAFRAGDGLDAIQNKIFTEKFLSDFEQAWHKFIKKKVLGKRELQTVGGKKLSPGDSRPPPEGTEGFALTDDSRGDLFLVAAETQAPPKAFAQESWWMLKAWGVPAQFYREAWKRAPDVLTGRSPDLIGGLYVLVAVPGPGGQDSRAFLLMPAWAPLSREKTFSARLTEATSKLVAKAKGKAKASGASQGAGAKASEESRSHTPRGPAWDVATRHHPRSAPEAPGAFRAPR